MNSILKRSVTVVSFTLQSRSLRHILFKRDTFPQFLNTFKGALHTSSSSLDTRDMKQSETGVAPKRKYRKPVDWLPFEWHRRPRFNIFEQGGDIHKENIYDPTSPKPDFEFSEELKTASEHIKRTFSLATASKAEIKEVCRRQLLERVQRHPNDLTSLEVRAALWTLVVRSLYEHGRKLKKERRGGRYMLAILIQKRNKLLTELRLIDDERFCWLLKELHVEYEPKPLGVHLDKYCKKWDLRRLTKEYHAKTIQDKKTAYHETLKQQQEAFLREKEEILAWIEKEEQALKSL